MSKDYGPNVVASSFIKQYYEMMTQTPENLHMFYKEDSNFMHSELNQAKNASGTDAIRTVINDLSFKNTKVDLSNGYIDAQKGANKSVVVVVVGQLSPSNDKPGKPFVHNFVLSCQGSTTSYYVSNSIFRLLVPTVDVEIAANLHHATPAAVVHHAPAASAPAPVAPAAAPIVEPVAAIVETPAPAVVEEETTAAVPEVNEPAPAPSVASAPESVVAPAAAAAVPVDPNKKLNYSDMVRKAASVPAPSAAPASTTVKVVKVAEKPAASSSNATSSGVAAGSSSSAANQNKDGSVHAAFVKQIPDAATVNELRELFVQFGTIHQIDWQDHRGYAFVKFDQASSLHAALGHKGSLQLHGANLKVEERVSTKNGPQGKGADNKGGNGGRKDGDNKQGKQGDNKNNKNDSNKQGGDKKGATSGTAGNNKTGASKPNSAPGANKH